ncbi:hypothetical protein EUTSA_v10005354mg [Eutrema salsugineum]|uniref:Uncharacterized protein n=2 Tax=Eutrema salsugineum TaxID=72664 RepID=V4KY89_EUTSA|nr:hypothetical protein EUTSA_v10005354mg [Eutrema salsugineum]
MKLSKYLKRLRVTAKENKCYVLIAESLGLESIEAFDTRARPVENSGDRSALCFSVFKHSEEEMHLWPSLKLRNSFKGNSQQRFQRMNSGKQTQSNQQKLLCRRDKESGPEISSGGFAVVVCRDLAMILSCCFCCFCCGACIDEEEN